MISAFFKNNFTKKNGKVRWSSVIGTIFLVGFLSFIIVVTTFLYYVFNIVDPTVDIDLHDLKLNEASIIYNFDQKTGQYVEYERIVGEQNREWVDMEHIPKHIQDAFIAIEDERFITHKGVDWKRTLGAALNYFTNIKGDTFGGSTITQQLIKNLTGEEEVRPERKIQEIVRALEFEKRFNKDEILESYINTIFLGQDCYGVQTAAKTYFGKTVTELTLAESASIVGITQYPYLYNPFNYPKKNKEKQERVLKKMLDLGKITQQEYDKAVKQKLVFAKKNTSSKVSKQTYFGDTLISQIINDLQKQKGYTKGVATQMVYSGGLKIYATVDPKIQKIMTDIYVNNKNFPKVRGATQPQSSMVVMDPYTGAVVGIIGGTGEKKIDRGLNRAVDTFRQPGSSIKPISVYAPAFEYNKINLGTILDDSPVDVAKKWPQNYDRAYRGLVSVRKAVEKSLNPPAVRALQMVGIKDSFNFLKNNLGVSSLVSSDDNRKNNDENLAPLALGGLTKGISVLELTAAYCPFVNKGVYQKPYAYTKVIDQKGNEILSNKLKPKISMSEQTAATIVNLLQSAVQYGTGSPAKLTSTPVAGKTGTTTSDNDRWFVGMTPSYVAAVWYGFDTPKTISIAGINPAVNIWKQVFSKIHKDLPRKQFPDMPSAYLEQPTAVTPQTQSQP